MRVLRSSWIALSTSRSGWRWGSCLTIAWISIIGSFFRSCCLEGLLQRLDAFAQTVQLFGCRRVFFPARIVVDGEQARVRPGPGKGAGDDRGRGNMHRVGQFQMQEHAGSAADRAVRAYARTAGHADTA